MCLCDQDVPNDKGCCCCCGSYVGVWILGILTVLGFIGSLPDLYFNAYNKMTYDPIMWENGMDGYKYQWNYMTDEQEEFMKEWHDNEVASKIMNIIGLGIMCLPFIAVLVMPKSVGARLCLFVMMLIDTILNIVGYIFVVISALMLASWWVDQAEATVEMRDQTSKTLNETKWNYLNQLGQRMLGMGAGTAVWAYSAMGFFIIWLAIECLLLSVFYKFYKTGKEWIK